MGKSDDVRYVQRLEFVGEPSVGPDETHRAKAVV